MDKRIKLIWDFRGPAAAKTAAHHEKHLQDYIALEKTALNMTGHEDVTDSYSYAYMVVEESEMISIRDALKPHRGVFLTN